MGEDSPLCRWILDRFPDNAAGFVSSLQAKLLSRISLSLIFLDDTSNKETLRALNKHGRSVELALKALQALSSMYSVGGEADKPTTAVDQYDVGVTMKVKNKTTQREKKKARRFESITVDDKPFQKIGLPVPNTPEEAHELTQGILRDQKHALEVF